MVNPDNTPYLQVRNLNVDLGGRAVLRDVSLDAYAGELMGLIGPNGAGKTTLMRAILGLTRRSSGSVLAGGKALNSATVGYVPQRHEFAWDFPISVRDAVLSGLTGSLGWWRRPGLAQQRAVEEALKRADLTHLSARPVGELSGGQKQRVLVARALALRPTLLLLDEPFTGLDMPTQDLLTDLFHTLAAEGQAIIMSTHDLLGARAHCDRLTLVNGTILASGTPQELHDPDLWSTTFQLRPDNPLLAALGLAFPTESVRAVG